MSNPRVGRDVYWRRRLLVLAILIAIVWGVLQLIGLVRGDDAGKAEATRPTPTPTTAPTAPPTTPPADQVAVAIETDEAVCEPENVRIVPSVPGGQFAGGPVAIDLMLTSLDGTACTFRPSTRELLVVVDTERAPIYDSSVCRAAFFDQSVSIPAGWSTVAPVEWTGRGSGAGCGSSEGFAPPGTYTLKIGTYGGEPGEVTFKLARRAPETPETKPTPAPAKKPGSEPTQKATSEPTQKPAPRPKPSSTAPVPR
ncbi:hypothetical protein H9L21_01795 [Aeromicrobium senzhongii]|uniref:DUF4232 domain-containing protein n=1 Tax=Aeromicrobium senzhongii TaxID=2663859 RepID=A0ABX6SZR9_9ACTN|nr:hypothetical protein [Aeromicrobium senzhongii]MTB88296.1 hypothetical protein [Aeromicrobium senzhongii]QNL94725.1 hypothetical protein H9L21_01795 [Aeromicrobium senzhongii]